MSLRVSVRYRPDRPDLFAAFTPPGGAVAGGPKAGREGPKARARDARRRGEAERLADRRRAAVTVREILGGRLDEFMMGPVRKLCEERYGVSDRHFLTFFNDVAEILFPSDWDEEEADRAEQAELRDRKIAAGLVPVAGLDRVSTPVLEAYRDEVVRWEDEA